MTSFCFVINYSNIETKVKNSYFKAKRKYIILVNNNLIKDGLIELNGKEYMLTAKVYEAIKSDIEYTKDKVLQYVKAKNRILDYLEKESFITNEKIRELCGFTKQQARSVIDKVKSENI